tara:strand:- start:122 stop:601 length:480 start_codon:yes stop_codon:yes gene_type:complete
MQRAVGKKLNKNNPELQQEDIEAYARFIGQNKNMASNFDIRTKTLREVFEMMPVGDPRTPRPGDKAMMPLFMQAPFNRAVTSKGGLQSVVENCMSMLRSMLKNEMTQMLQVRRGCFCVLCTVWPRIRIHVIWLGSLGKIDLRFVRKLQLEKITHLRHRW